MLVASCDFHVFLDSLGHWHVFALSPIRKLSSPPHRQHLQRHFVARMVGPGGASEDVPRSDYRRSCRRRCFGFVCGNLLPFCPR